MNSNLKFTITSLADLANYLLKRAESHKHEALAKGISARARYDHFAKADAFTDMADIVATTEIVKEKRKKKEKVAP